jgi:hypothetical protein
MKSSPFRAGRLCAAAFCVFATVAPGVVRGATDGAPSSEKKAPPVVASDAFRSYIAGIRILGIMNANSAAVYVDRGGVLGKVVFRVGEIMHTALGVRLHSINFETTVVVFEDKTGARISVRP